MLSSNPMFLHFVAFVSINNLFKYNSVGFNSKQIKNTITLYYWKNQKFIRTYICIWIKDMHIYKDACTHGTARLQSKKQVTMDCMLYVARELHVRIVHIITTYFFVTSFCLKCLHKWYNWIQHLLTSKITVQHVDVVPSKNQVLCKLNHC